MNEQSNQSRPQNRGPWIIAGAILVATALVVGVLLFQRSKDDACKRWQAEVQDMAVAYGGDLSIAAVFVATERPDACPLP